VQVAKQASMPIRSQEDVVIARQAVRKSAIEAGMNLVDQTKIVTAASELGRNAFIYGGGGTILIEQIEDGRRRGLRLTFEDQGPGIADIERGIDGWLYFRKRLGPRTGRRQTAFQ
jgi:serine/threonine-protein kinase RsbT